MPAKPNGGFQGVSPVLMSSACTLLVNNSAVPDSGQLSYPFRKAILIDEIRWTLRINGTTQLTLGPLVYTKLNFGRHYLMRDPVPIWLLGTLMSGYVEGLVADSTPSTAQVFSHYRWRLPEPLYLEAGEILRSQFSRGADGFGNVDVQVTYVGRTVAPNQPRPRVIPVPYVAPWVTTLGNTYQQSNEAHLFNPFDVPIRIQRLTGRVNNLVLGSTSAPAIELTPLAGTTSVTLLMHDSWGGKMVNNQTGPSDIFDAPRAAWTVDTIMPPKGVYNIQALNIDAAQTVHVAMIGVREERL